MKYFLSIGCCLAALFVSVQAFPAQEPAAVERAATPAATPGLISVALNVLAPTPDLRVPPERWQEWPVVPERMSARTLEIYAFGLDLGNNPHAFSKFGDNGASTLWFLAHYDSRQEFYNLGAFTTLQPVIEMFAGSFGRVSPAAGSGYTTTTILNPAQADEARCDGSETLLDCELRLHRPSIAFFSIGTNQAGSPEIFEAELRIILERMLARGVVPILSTKVDNREGDHSINRIIANLAYEYELPLWNFWRAAQPLPNHGLQPDEEHLSWASPYFDDPVRMKSAWPWRNLTALQVLNYFLLATNTQP